MQGLDEDTRAERKQENDVAVERVWRANAATDIEVHSGPDRPHCDGAGSRSSSLPCKRCMHFYTKGRSHCPHCHGQTGARAETSAGEAAYASRPREDYSGYSYFDSRAELVLGAKA